MACGVFVEFFRAVPVLMMMPFAYYVFLFGIQISGESFFRCWASLRVLRSTIPALSLSSSAPGSGRCQWVSGRRLAIGSHPSRRFGSCRCRRPSP